MYLSSADDGPAIRRVGCLQKVVGREDCRFLVACSRGIYPSKDYVTLVQTGQLAHKTHAFVVVDVHG